MKITKVDVIQEKVPERASWRPILCRIYTDEGIYGDGEAALAYGIAAPAAFGMVRDQGQGVQRAYLQAAGRQAPG